MKNSRARKIAVTAIMAAVSTVLMFLSFSVPFVPSFLKFDFSELPALLTGFALGPVSGAVVCLVKNLINVMFTTTMGIGELSNFILGCLFVVPASIIYKKRKTKKAALIGSLSGSAVMAGASVFSNYYLIYPIYALSIPMDAIMGMYKAILPSVSNLWQALLIFNLPFTLVKGLINVFLCMLIYKKLSPLLKGTK